MNLILASTASLLHCCSAQAFLPPNDALRTRSTEEKCLAMSIFFKSLVSQINPLHWLDYTAVLCTNYYCSNSSRTKIWTVDIPTPTNGFSATKTVEGFWGHRQWLCGLSRKIDGERTRGCSSRWQEKL